MCQQLFGSPVDLTAQENRDFVFSDRSDLSSNLADLISHIPAEQPLSAIERLMAEAKS
ncbi:MAG: hypothetical protein RMX96_02620 [Nostoc sp. ChiSLP02]|nr:hypothetical protein [Nostoc sp. DedSLP01]MDZ8183741.1 hypothetical protein [Nostoc sp. ChiSLP02]